MGLSGRKVKQRIGHDPRNLTWADDANKFGAAYLQKLGWSAGTGLGTSGEGRTSHIKVHQKLDMLGIGAAHQKDPNGIAWKQNRDFENLLRRLNGSDGDEQGASGTKVDGFIGAGRREEEGSGQADESRAESDDKKRKRSQEAEDGEEKEKKDKKKKKKSEKRSRKDALTVDEMDKDVKKEDDAASESPTEATLVGSGESTPTSVPQTPNRPIARHPHRAHRARFIASKRLALTSSTAMDEILGISRSGSSTPYPPTSVPDTPSEPPIDLGLQELTTSSKSVMDYFKEKLLAKSNSRMSSSSAPDSPRATEADDQEEDRPTGGLGFRAGLGSKLRFELGDDDEDTPKRGLGSFSRGTSSLQFNASSFLRSTSYKSEEVDDGKTVVAEQDEGDEIAGTSEKKEKKKKKSKSADREPRDLDAEKRRKDKKRKRREGEGDVKSEITGREDSKDEPVTETAIKQSADDARNGSGEIVEENLKSRKKKKKKSRET